MNYIVGYKQRTGNLVFDIKLGNNFWIKITHCADRYKNDPHTSLVYTNL